MYTFIIIVLMLLGGAVAQRVERWTCDQQVVATRGKSYITTLGKLFTPSLEQLAGSSPFFTISAAFQEVFEDRTVRTIIPCVTL